MKCRGLMTQQFVYDEHCRVGVSPSLSSPPPDRKTSSSPDLGNPAELSAYVRRRLASVSSRTMDLMIMEMRRLDRYRYIYISTECT